MEENTIATALQSVIKRVEDAKLKAKRDDDVCIVAVSKTKPKSMIIEAYNCGHRDFGENYVNELVDKASDEEGDPFVSQDLNICIVLLPNQKLKGIVVIPLKEWARQVHESVCFEVLDLCPDIKWHFIGHLQSNKVNKLIGIKNLHMIHTVDSKKLADLVDRAWSKQEKSEPLKIMIQVNTSGEESPNNSLTMEDDTTVHQLSSSTTLTEDEKVIQQDESGSEEKMEDEASTSEDESIENIPEEQEEAEATFYRFMKKRKKRRTKGGKMQPSPAYCHESKSGISPDEVVGLAQHIIENCTHVHLAGLMLIGYANYDLTLGPNPEFQMLSKHKKNVCEKFNIDPENFGLSMGMSQDFEHAIELGSNYIRVGSTIFGAREKKM